MFACAMNRNTLLEGLSLRFMLKNSARKRRTMLKKSRYSHETLWVFLLLRAGHGNIVSKSTSSCYAVQYILYKIFEPYKKFKTVEVIIFIWAFDFLSQFLFYITCTVYSSYIIIILSNVHFTCRYLNYWRCHSPSLNCHLVWQYWPSICLYILGFVFVLLFNQ